MTQDEFVQWAISEGVSDNEFSARGIWNWDGRGLWNYTGEDARKMATLYREWRNHCKNTKLCFALAEEGMELPEMYKTDSEETVKEIEHQ